MSGARPQSYYLEENRSVWPPGNHQQHKSCEYICCCYGIFFLRSCNPLFIDCTWFQAVYKEVERRPALVSDDLSPRNITVDSSLLNTQSKCEFLVVHGLKCRLLLENKSNFYNYFATCCSRRAVSTARAASCGQTGPWPSKPQDGRLCYGV